MLIVNRMLVIEELERRSKRGENNIPGVNAIQMKRITSVDLAKELNKLKSRELEYFIPSPAKSNQKMQTMGNRIKMPYSLLEIREGAKARNKALRSKQ